MGQHDMARLSQLPKSGDTMQAVTGVQGPEWQDIEKRLSKLFLHVDLAGEVLHMPSMSIPRCVRTIWPPAS